MSAGTGIYLRGGSTFRIADGSIITQGPSIACSTISDSEAATISIVGSSTLVECTSDTDATIHFYKNSTGATLGGQITRATLTIGTEGSSSTTFPHIKNRRAGWGIYKEGSDITINKYSGKVD